MTDEETMKRVLANQEAFITTGIPKDYAVIEIVEYPERMGWKGHALNIISAFACMGILWLIL